MMFASQLLLLVRLVAMHAMAKLSHSMSVGIHACVSLYNSSSYFPPHTCVAGARDSHDTKGGIGRALLHQLRPRLQQLPGQAQAYA